MSVRASFLILLFYLSMFSVLRAQIIDPPSNDLVTWTNLKVQMEITKNLDIFIAPEVRTFNKEIDKYLSDVGIKYKISKWLDAGITYRYAQESKKKGGFKTSHRLALDLKTSNSYGDFDPTLRLRFTNKYDVKDSKQIQNLRLKGSIDYDVPKSKITPFVQSEIFYKLTKSQWSKYRLGAGASLKLSKANSIQMAYILERDVDNKDNEHIVSLGYKYKL